MREQWKDVFGFDGKYQVSNLGRVKRISKNGEKLIVIRHEFKLPSVYLSKFGIQTWVPVCELVAKAFIANPSGYKYVRYKNGYKYNNRASNFEYVEKINETDIGCEIK